MRAYAGIVVVVVVRRGRRLRNSGDVGVIGLLTILHEAPVGGHSREGRSHIIWDSDSWLPYRLPGSTPGCRFLLAYRCLGSTSCRFTVTVVLAWRRATRRETLTSILVQEVTQPFSHVPIDAVAPISMRLSLAAPVIIMFNVTAIAWSKSVRQGHVTYYLYV